MAVSPHGTRAYVTNESSLGSVSVIDTATNRVTATVRVGRGPAGVAVSPDGTRAYVTVEHNRSVSVIDTATDQVTATIDVHRVPEGVAVSPDGARAYVTTGASLGQFVSDRHRHMSPSSSTAAVAPAGELGGCCTLAAAGPTVPAVRAAVRPQAGRPGQVRPGPVSRSALGLAGRGAGDRDLGGRAQVGGHGG